MALPSIKLGANDKDAEQSSQRDLDRPTANDIYEQVALNGKHELSRSSVPLMFSAVAGGLLMGLTGLSVAILNASIGMTPAGRLIALFFYPLGFTVVILGRSQLFTENTLYPVAWYSQNASTICAPCGCGASSFHRMFWVRFCSHCSPSKPDPSGPSTRTLWRCSA